MPMRILFAFAPLLILGACATLNENECRAGNWYAIGKSDGNNGRDADFIYQHAKACNEFGVLPVRSEWERGRQEGLKLYCTPGRAYSEGKRGRIIRPVCPAEISYDLDRANQRGLRVHRIDLEIREIENDIRAINTELASLPADDPARSTLVLERSALRLDLISLRAERARYR